MGKSNKVPQALEEKKPQSACVSVSLVHADYTLLRDGVKQVAACN